MVAKAWLSKELKDKKVLCLACAHACKLEPNAYGICGVRVNQDGELKLTVYGLAAAAHVDPVEKKPLFHFLPNSKVFSIGTVGCNLSCAFCQNWEISQHPQTHNYEVFGYDIPPKKVVSLAKEYECRSIAYTYNEPVVYFEYTYDTAKLAKEAGLKNIYVTSGYETRKAIDKISPYLDAMNIDIKFFKDESYQKISGARLKPVLESIKYAHSKGIWIETTTLIIPGINDSDEELRDIAKFIADLDPDIPWHISRFHPDYKMLDRPPTPIKTLKRAYEIAKEEGLKYIYIGNYPDSDLESTYCPTCGFKVIERDGYIGEKVINHLTANGSCPKCDTNIAGIWK
ncbi:MAG TPA: AmmeMemoRadiSam system radical SAM enzyme [Campylobacterales bacterium]|nr:AmmeMemoRadiSam system radical SAM enzyme [Campylobacterales bacterium]